MAIALNPYNRHDEWAEEFRRLLPDEDIRVWPEIGDPAEIDLVVAWRMPREALTSYTNLRAILSVSAGAEQWLRPGVPDVPVVRLADPAMSSDMAAFCLHWVIRFHRNFDQVAANQQRREWRQIPYESPSRHHVGILGYGTIGSRIGAAFADLGYAVNAWSRTSRDSDGVNHFAGNDQLEAFLASSHSVINVLPNTPETTGVLNRSTLSMLPQGAVLINVGRGNAVVEEELLQVLDDGPLEAAVLDVTDPEPPTPESPLFEHPRVHLTSHVAGLTGVTTSAQLIAANITRIRSSETPFPLLERDRGY